MAGSINIDLVTLVPALPVPGQTVLGSELAYHPGGKGANQAVAASRAGAAVTMIGAVGDDSFGDRLVAFLASNGVNTSGVVRVAGAPTRRSPPTTSAPAPRPPATCWQPSVRPVPKPPSRS